MSALASIAPPGAPFRSLVLVIAALLIAACSVVDPETGAPQASCGLRTTFGQSAQGPGLYGTNQAPAPPSCDADAGSSCDNCESQHCCATRGACYGDPVCACLDSAFDACLDAASSNPAAKVAARVSQCWATFEASGTVEEARVACERSWCQSECKVP